MSYPCEVKVVSDRDASGAHALVVQPQPPAQPAPGSDEVEVLISHAALNRRDHWIRKDLYPALVFPWTLGADACGVVTRVASAGHVHLLGQRVVLNASVGRLFGWYLWHVSVHLCAVWYTGVCRHFCCARGFVN